MNVEKYTDGKLIKGKNFSPWGGEESYKNKIYCTLEPRQSFLNAERFRTDCCYKTQAKNDWEYATYPGGMDRFFNEIKQKLVLRGTTRVTGTIQVQTIIDSTGKMTNFKPVSRMGYEYDLIEVLETMNNWYPTKVNGKATTQVKIISLEVL